MKRYASLLLLAGVVGVLSVLFRLSRTADPLVAGLTSLLSPATSIVLPSSPLFVNLTRRCVDVYNPGIAAVVRVGTEADVPLIISYAKQNGRTLFIGSGRHGWGASLNDVRDAIMVDITPLSAIAVDSTTNTVTVGGGATTGRVIEALHSAGKETSAGGCDCVGFLGPTLGGGHGRLQGRYGLIADNLLSARLATASGEIVTVSNTSHAELFWGLRGAGHNFGIVTEAVYRIYDQPNGGIDFSVDITYEPEHLEDIFTALNAFSLEQPADTTVFTIFVPRPGTQPFIALSFISSSPAATALEILNRAFGHLPHTSRTESLIPADHTNRLGVFGVGVSSCTNTARKNAHGVSLTHYHIPAVRGAFTLFAVFLAQNPEAHESVIVFESYPVHAVMAVPEAETAYPHRQERHIILLLAVYPRAKLDGVAAQWLGSAAGLLHVESGFEKPAVYLNYAHGGEGLGASYGYEEWRMEKLKGLKRRWDPEGVFNAFHPIPSV